MKKTWNVPEVKAMDINNTEYFARSGVKIDGSYTDKDNVVIEYTYSGAFETGKK